MENGYRSALEDKSEKGEIMEFKYYPNPMTVEEVGKEYNKIYRKLDRLLISDWDDDQTDAQIAKEERLKAEYINRLEELGERKDLLYKETFGEEAWIARNFEYYSKPMTSEEVNTELEKTLAEWREIRDKQIQAPSRELNKLMQPVLVRITELKKRKSYYDRQNA
jgi:hypothetical protein